ncbi:MAG: hypothetical protein WAN87_08780, partial [Thermoplasmata archaeon]
VVLSSRKGEAGIQTGMAEMFQDLGASIGPVLVATILASFTGAYATGIVGPNGPVLVILPTSSAFQYLFGVGAVLSMACGILAIFLKNYTFSPAGTESESSSPAGLPSAATGVSKVTESTGVR